MKRRTFSYTYVTLLELLNQIRGQAIENAAYSNNISGNSFTRTNTGHKTHRLPQPIIMADISLYGNCSSAEWSLIGRVMSELREYNALWSFPDDLKRNSTVFKALKSLLDKRVLFKTETSNIYLVNPLHIRRGDFFTVLTTTANMLKDVPKLGHEHIVNKKPVKQFNFELIDDTKSIGYGYVNPDDMID